MTTKVLIVNFGPDAINVKIDDSHGSPREQFIYPAGSHEFYVHAHQSLSVVEQPPAKQTTPTPTTPPEVDTSKPFASSDFN